MARSLVTYFDYKSPYAFVAKDLIQELAVECGVTLEWRPYTLHIPDFLGSAEVNERGERVADARNAHQWRRVMTNIPGQFRPRSLLSLGLG